MVTYYLMATIFAVFTLLLFIHFYEGKRISYYFILIALLMALSNGGYLAIAVATNLEEAILASKISYLGGCFVPPIVLFLICTICNIQIPRLIRMIMYIFSVFVYLMVLGIGYHDLYYAETFLETYKGATILGRSYGIGHGGFYVLIYGYIVIETIFLLYALKKKMEVSRKNIWILLLLEISTIFLYAIGRMMDSEVEILPLVYVVDGWILLCLHSRVMLYNAEDSIISSLEKQTMYGYIFFDRKKNYLGSNQMAKEMFPDIVGCHVDKPINGSQGTNQLLQWMEEYIQRGTMEFPYEYEEQHYECMVKENWTGKKFHGYTIELREDTDKWKYMNLLADYNSRLEKEVEKKTEHIANIQSQVLIGLASVVESRDNTTGGHIKRTSDVVQIMVNKIREEQLLPLEEEFCKAIVKAAPLHDIGKIGIDDSILKKQGKLTEDEYEIMKTHAEKSAVLVEQILNNVEDDAFVEIAKNVARYHHEKWDGSGYVNQLQGEEIPIEARIMAIADVLDALMSKRSYKEAMNFDEVYAIMMDSMGSHFDPKMAKVLELSKNDLSNYYKV